MRKLGVFILTLLACTIILTFFQLPIAKADITETRIFTTSTSDGRLNYADASYSIAHDAASAGSSAPSGISFEIGQAFAAAYFIYRGYLYFDSSAIPDIATIDNAVLSIYIKADNSTNDFNVTIQSGQPTYPHDPFELDDYYYTRYSGDGGSANTSTISGAGYWNITLNSDGLNMISQTTTTKLCLRSNNDIDSIEPVSLEYIQVYAREQGSSYAPKLYVTYTISTENMYVYNVYGPYVDSPTGTIYNGYVNVTVYPNYNETYAFQLDGTGETEDSETLYFEQPPIMMTWNVSNTGNYTRTIYFTDATTEDFYIFIPNQDEPYYYYSFGIIDMQGITNGYLESRVYLNGEYRVVERQSASSINSLPFIMQWSVIYKMRVVCDQGTLSTGDFTALNEASQNIIIPYGAFPATQYGFHVSVSCMRLNSTLIQMNYTDDEEATIWVNVAVTHLSGSTEISDYSENNTDNTVQVNWNSADALTNYKATVTFYRDSQVYTYRFACDAPAEEAANPWGFLPVPYCYAVATALTLFFGLVGSYATKVAAAWAMVVSAAWFTWIAWFPQTSVTWGIISFAGLVSALLTISEFKKVERQI